MKIRVFDFSIAKRIPVNGKIYNNTTPEFQAMLIDAQKGFAVLTREPSNLPSQFLQEDIKRVEPEETF